MIRAADSNFNLRYRLALAAQQHGIRAAARAFHCARNTVRKWLRRFQQAGKPGLQPRSRAPHKIPHKTPPAVERKVLASRDRKRRVENPVKNNVPLDLKHSAAQVWLVGPEAADLVKNNVAFSEVVVFQRVTPPSPRSCKEHRSGFGAALPV
jgi:transposase-like protein